MSIFQKTRSLSSSKIHLLRFTSKYSQIAHCLVPILRSKLQNSQDSIHRKECIELSGSMAAGPSMP